MLGSSFQDSFSNQESLSFFIVIFECTCQYDRTLADPNEAWNADTVFELIKHIKEGDLCCAGTKSAASGHHGLTSKGLSPGHAYAILGSMEIDGTWCMVVEWGVVELWSGGL